MLYLLDIVKIIADSLDEDLLELESILVSAICRMVQQIFETPKDFDDKELGKAFKNT